MDSAVQGGGARVLGRPPWLLWHCSLHARWISLLSGFFFTSSALSVVCLQPVTLNASPFQRRGTFPSSVPGHLPRKAPRDLAPPAVIRWCCQEGSTEDGPWFPDGPLSRSGKRRGLQRGRADPWRGSAVIPQPRTGSRFHPANGFECSL